MPRAKSIAEKANSIRGIFDEEEAAGVRGGRGALRDSNARWRIRQELGRSMKIACYRMTLKGSREKLTRDALTDGQFRFGAASEVSSAAAPPLLGEDVLITGAG